VLVAVDVDLALEVSHPLVEDRGVLSPVAEHPFGELALASAEDARERAQLLQACEERGSPSSPSAAT